MNNDCERARGCLALWADGELAASEATWIESHWHGCVACQAERNRFRNLDGRLLSFGRTLAEKIGTSPVDRARFLARTEQAERAKQKPLVFIPAAAALLAAAAVVFLPWLPLPAPRTAGTEENGFVPVPYVPPIASYERSSVVSMQIPVANLLAEGYSISADPSSVVQADILLGEDGRMHAVRLAANQILKGAGD